MSKLTPKQQRFADEYIKEPNATQAAKKAGYSENSAEAIGFENLRKPKIAEYIKKRMEKVEKKLIADADEVLETLTRTLRREATEHIVVTVKSRRVYTDDEGNKVTEDVEIPQVVEIPAMLKDVNKSAELIGKRWKIFDRLLEDDESEKAITINIMRAGE